MKFNTLILFWMGICHIVENKADCIEVYKKYLGPDYTPPNDYTTIIVNHTNWIVYN
jgi:hypothetical protein